MALETAHILREKATDREAFLAAAFSCSQLSEIAAAQAAKRQLTRMMTSKVAPSARLAVAACAARRAAALQ